MCIPLRNGFNHLNTSVLRPRPPNKPLWVNVAELTCALFFLKKKCSSQELQKTSLFENKAVDAISQNKVRLKWHRPQLSTP